jgi:hypothetical protein
VSEDDGRFRHGPEHIRSSVLMICHASAWLSVPVPTSPPPESLSQSLTISLERSIPRIGDSWFADADIVSALRRGQGVPCLMATPFSMWSNALATVAAGGGVKSAEQLSRDLVVVLENASGATTPSSAELTFLKNQIELLHDSFDAYTIPSQEKGVCVPSTLAKVLTLAGAMESLGEGVQRLVQVLNEKARARVVMMVGVGGNSAPLVFLQRILKRVNTKGECLVDPRFGRQKLDDLTSLLNQFEVPCYSLTGELKSEWKRPITLKVVESQLLSAENEVSVNRELDCVFRFLVLSNASAHRGDAVNRAVSEEEARNMPFLQLKERNDLHEASFGFRRPDHHNVLPALRKLGRPVSWGPIAQQRCSTTLNAHNQLILKGTMFQRAFELRLAEIRSREPHVEERLQVSSDAFIRERFVVSKTGGQLLRSQQR